MPKDGQDFLHDPYLNGSAINGFEEYVKTTINPISDDKLELADYKIKVINTPGHCRGCVIYYFENENILFTGDSILKDMSVPIRPTGSKEEKRKSMRKFINLGYEKDTPVFPGHGKSTTYGYLLENNPDIKEVKNEKSNRNY